MTCFKCICTVVNKFTTMKKSGAVCTIFHLYGQCQPPAITKVHCIDESLDNFVNEYAIWTGWYRCVCMRACVCVCCFHLDNILTGPFTLGRPVL